MTHLAHEPPLTDPAYFFEEPADDPEMDRIAAAACELAEQIKALAFPADRVHALLFWLDDFEMAVNQGLLRPEGANE